MQIEIHGLDSTQKRLADQIWACDSQEQVDALIHSMPPALRRRAEVVRELMIAAVWDQIMEITEDVSAYIAAVGRG